MLPTLSFTAFVFWLLAVPMNGPLTMAAGIADATRFFLLPHVAALALIGAVIPSAAFQRLAPAGTVLTVVISLALPIWPDAAPWLLVLLSICGAFVAIDATTRLHGAQSPVLAAALGLVFANLLLFLLHLRSGGQLFHFALVALPLLILLAPMRDIRPEPIFTSARLWQYLPFVLAFHIVSGLMYRVIYPAYQPLAILAGIELPFYMVTVLGAAWLVKRHRELALIFGVLSAMAAFAFLQHQQPLTVNLSMFAMQAGQGFVDLFLLAFLLSFTRPIRAFGFGLATLCLGIFGGQLIGHHLQDIAGAIVMTGLIILNFAVMTLYFVNRRHPPLERPEPSALQSKVSEEARAGLVLATDTKTGGDFQPETNSSSSLDSFESRVPDNLRLLLSERECLVLAHSLDGRTYRQIANALDISESSVKTYMKRICDKLGVHGRKGLFDALEAKANERL
jgi:DNA-binding CsgD family transcriptional regulator